jgi:predicted enzyme related to lactoylglutathione lyase
MASDVSTIIYPVKDLTNAKALFSTLLGTAPYVDQPYYVGFHTDGPEIGLDPHGHNHGAGPVCYWEVADIEQALQQLVDAGAEALEDPHDVGGGLLIATVKDASGNVLGLRQPA